MERRSLGNSGLHVSRIGLGCVTFGREIDEKTSFEIMDYAISQGVNLFDTAEAYCDGESERIIGRWLRARGCRDQIVLQSKVKPPFTRQHISEALEASRARLGVDQIDLYLLHEFDPSVPVEETMQAMTLAVRSGRIRAAGCSNFTVEQLQSAENLHTSQGFSRFDVVQSVYNLVAREIEDGLLSYCRKHAIGVVSYSPLAAGFLTGKYTRDSVPAQGSRFHCVPGHCGIYFKAANFDLVEKLRSLSDRSGLSMPRLALEWTLRNNDVDSILAGATSISHIQNAIETLKSEPDPNLIEEMDRWEM